MSVETPTPPLPPAGRFNFHQWFFVGHRWIPLLFILFFLILFVVSGNFVRLALTTFPGLVSTNAYERGLAYDEVIAAEQAQAEQGWQIAFDLPGLSGEGQTARLNLVDRDGNPIAGANVIMMAERMTRYAQQVRITLSDQGNGQYEAPITFPIAGRWFVSVLADASGERHFETREIFLDAPGVN